MKIYIYIIVFDYQYLRIKKKTAKMYGPQMLNSSWYLTYTLIFFISFSFSPSSFKTKISDYRCYWSLRQEIVFCSLFTRSIHCTSVEGRELILPGFKYRSCHPRHLVLHFMFGVWVLWLISIVMKPYFMLYWLSNWSKKYSVESTGKKTGKHERDNVSDRNFVASVFSRFETKCAECWKEKQKVFCLSSFSKWFLERLPDDRSELCTGQHLFCWAVTPRREIGA